MVALVYHLKVEILRHFVPQDHRPKFNDMADEESPGSTGQRSG